MGLPKVMLDVAYARCEQKSGSLKIHLERNQNAYEITFRDQNDLEKWILKLKKVCILTNFKEKYQMIEMTEISRDRCECLLEAKMGGNHYSARKFDKKQINLPENSLTMIRLMNKIEILRALKTEKILHLNEVYETTDSIYLVTDFTQEFSLKNLLRAAPSPLNGSKTQSIMHQFLKVLAEMASKNIAHRNLKPSSILVELKDHIRVTNFCLATFINGPHANVGICGTPGYIAPEVLNCNNENRIYDDKVDVFSAGCIFFEMLFGYPLFKGSNTSEVSILNKNFKYSDLIQLVMKEKKDLRCLLTKLSFDLLLKLLHIDPKQRISAKEALLDAYFKWQESADSANSSEDETRSPTKNSQKSSVKNGCQRVSFDLSQTFSEGISDTVGFREDSSTLHPCRNSIRKLSADTSERSTSPRLLKNQQKFKSSEQIKFPIVPMRFKEDLILSNNEDSENIFDESSGGLSVSKNYPKEFHEIKKHPNQRSFCSAL